MAVDHLERSLEQLFRLYSSRKVHSRLAAAAGTVVSQPGAALLRRLDEHGPLTLGELATLTQMDPSATGRQVKQLVVDGLVARAQNVEDGRSTVVRLTQRGAAVRRRFTKVGHQHLEDALAGWSKADRAALADLLARLVDDLRSIHYRELNEAAAG